MRTPHESLAQEVRRRRQASANPATRLPSGTSEEAQPALNGPVVSRIVDPSCERGDGLMLAIGGQRERLAKPVVRPPILLFLIPLLLLIAAAVYFAQEAASQEKATQDYNRKMEVLRLEAQALQARLPKLNQQFAGMTGDETTQTTRTQPPTQTRPRQGISPDNSDRMATYATVLGRAIGCHINVTVAGDKVGGWLKRVTAPGADESNMTVIFMSGVIAARDAQRGGRSPDDCDAVRENFDKVSWPA